MKNQDKHARLPLERRQFLHFTALTAAACLLPGCVTSASTPPPELDESAQPGEQAAEAEVTAELPVLPPGLSKGKEALLQLIVGNLRYVSGHLRSPHQTVERRQELTSGQHPIAAILSCSDSRLPPEVIFDQGLGDLFVVRVAGNVAAFDDVVASLEYAVEHLEVPLVMVLGHQKCGAITAALQGGEAEGSLAELMEALHPAVEKAKSMSGDKLENAIRTNVKLTRLKMVADSEILSHAVEGRKVDLVGAYYSLDTGKVDLI